MHEVSFILIGLGIGTLGTLIATYLGGYLVIRTYLELTTPHIDNTVEDNSNTDTTQPEGYDWDEYDNYLTPPLVDDEEGPKA